MTGDLFENNESGLPKPKAEKGSLKEYIRKALDEGQPKYRIIADMTKSGYANQSIKNAITSISREGKPKSSKGRKVENAKTVNKLVSIALSELNGNHEAASAACFAAGYQIKRQA